MTEQEKQNRAAIRESMLQRVRYGQPHTGTVIQAIQQVFEIDDRFRSKLAAVQSDVKLSAKGRETEIANFVRRDLMPDLARATRSVRKARKHAQSRRAVLEEPLQVDPKDAVGELRRQEIRSYLRGLSEHQRLSVANQFIRDDASASAILDAPPALSGLSEPFYGQLRTAVAERINGPALQDLAAVEADFGQGDAAAGIVMNDLVKASGLTAKAFAEEMAPLEAKADA
ncbi:hypothetical protein [Methylobacterium sp. 391_Methyba4]|uniref:hypothetical protein n=1 Tax=Methylobacterium sp. 391_Methyba4 TaxID=3038924 RepID=UPI00241F3C02|nr:hypothetical protein [Methylobacterium sp. 391_Methyba4]WFS10367.1 hypothetical protein P9K36_14280 [Methylobacterium sp. 391_Methyba4]